MNREAFGSASQVDMKSESELLKQWRLDASAPANFNSVVWRRIEERRMVSGREAIIQWMNELFARRAVAFAYLSLAVLFGLSAAHVQSTNLLRERETQLQAQYIQSVDPYAPGAMP